MLRRLNPRLGVDGNPAAGYLRRDHDAVQADVEHAHAVGQASNLEGDATLEAVVALDLDRQVDFLPRLDGNFGLFGDRDEVAWLDRFRPLSCRFAHNLLA